MPSLLKKFDSDSQEEDPIDDLSTPATTPAGDDDDDGEEENQQAEDDSLESTGIKLDTSVGGDGAENQTEEEPELESTGIQLDVGGEDQQQTQQQEAQIAEDEGGGLFTKETLQRVEERETGGISEARRDTIRGDAGEVGRNQVQAEVAVDPGFGVEPLADNKEEAVELLEQKDKNREFRTRLLEGYKKEFGTTRKALAAYNWGPTNVQEIIDEGKYPEKLPDKVKGYVNEVAPEGFEAVNKVEEGGLPVDEEEVQAEMDKAQSPEQSVKIARKASTEAKALTENADSYFDAGFEYASEFANTIPNALERGGKQLVAQAGEAAEFADRVVDRAGRKVLNFAKASTTPKGRRKIEENIDFEETGFDQVTDYILKGAEENLKSYAASIDTVESNLKAPDNFYDYFKPKQLARVLGEEAPTTIGLGAATYANPWIGGAMMLGIEGGNYLEQIDRAEKRSDKEISEDEKLMGALTVGSANMAMERYGLDRIAKAARVPGLKSKVLQTLLSGGAEGVTETTQELNAMLTEDFQLEEKMGVTVDSKGINFNFDERDVDRLVHSFYAGQVVGTTLGGAGATLESYVESGKPDAEYAGVEFDEDGAAVPKFRVTRDNADLEGEVTRDELENNNLKPPKYRVAMFRDEMTTRLNEQLDDSNYDSVEQRQREVDKAVRAQLLLMDQFAANKGVSLEKYLEENKVAPARGGIMTEDALRQFAGTKADWGETERNMLEKAKEMDEQGAGKEEIRKVTGWFRNPNDSKWRYEVPSETMDFKLTPDETTSGEMKIGDVVDTSHRIFELYPELENTTIEWQDGRGGSFQRQEGTDVGKIRIGKNGNWMQTFWHELQHGIQYIEGFNRGASPRDRSLLRDQNNEAGRLLDKKDQLEKRANELQSKMTDPELAASEITDVVNEMNEVNIELSNIKGQLREMFDVENIQKAAVEAYENVAGEIEARTAARRNMMREMSRRQNKLRREMNAEENIEQDRESPLKTLEDETDQDVPVILRMYENPVRTQIQKEGKSPLLQSDAENNVTKGAFEQTRDGRTLIRLLENGDKSTLPHEISHLFRKTLTSQQNARLKDLLGIENWDREAEEKFARMWERHLAEGERETQNKDLQNVFDQYSDWMAEVYGGVSGSEIDVEINEDIRNFMDDLMERRYNQEEGRSLSEKVVDWFDVESRFSRLGQEKTGRYLKTHWTFKEMKKNQGEQIMRRMGRILDGDVEKARDAILAAEDDSVYENASDNVQQAADELRAYFDRAKKEYQKYGKVQKGFHDRLAGEIQRKIERLEEKDELSDEQRNTLEGLQEQLDRVEELNFVHIPASAWFGDMADSSPGQMQKILSIMAERERDTVSIQDMLNDEAIPLEKEDIHLEDIIGSYANQLGNDLSLLRIREAAVREGAAVKGEADKLEPAPDEASVFDGYQVNKPLQSWLKFMTTNRRTAGRLKDMINLSKMFAFWNPLFLPVYDVVQQAARVGPLKILKDSAKAAVGFDNYMRKAWQDVMNQSDEFWRADEYGLSSKPFSSPLRQTLSDFQQAFMQGKYEGKGGKEFGTIWGRVMAQKDYIWEGPRMQQMANQMAERQGGDQAKAESQSRNLLDRNVGTRTLGAMYQTSWDMSWFLDRVVRQATYRHLKDEKGKSAEEAAQQAARAHGDYASVPQSTRDTLNAFLFTPTFKIAMGKFFGDTLRGIGQVVTNKENPSSRELAGTAMRATAMLTAFDAMMTLAWGFEREEWGRSYCRPSEHTRTPKRMCLSWSSPINLFSKYTARVYDAFNDPTSFNPAMRLFNSNRWELNPMWRVMLEVGQNRSSSGGSIYNELDPPQKKFAKSLGYSLNNIVAASQMVIGEDAGAKGREALAEDIGTWKANFTTMFTFPYLTPTKAQQRKRQIDQLLNVMDREVGLSKVQRMIKQGADKERIQNFIETMPERKDEAMERLNQIVQAMDREEAKGMYDRPQMPQTLLNQTQRRAQEGEAVEGTGIKLNP